MKRIVIADDLTGANNVGVLLTHEGLSAIVVTYNMSTFDGTGDVLCIDTDSRYLPAEEAMHRVRRVVQRERSRGATLFCNRVDNLLRGNIGAETAGILTALGPDALAVIAPAFPALKRHVVDGHLIVDGQPLHQNPIAANDPFAPVRQSSIAHIVAQQFDAPISALGLSDVESGVARLAQRLEAAAAAGSRAVVVDASTNEHLRIIAAAMAHVDRPSLPVDPGPLSALYLRTQREKVRTSRGCKILASIGSITPLSTRQLTHFLSRINVDAVRLDAQALLASEDARQTAIAEAAAECLSHIQDSDIVVVTTQPADHCPADLARIARERGVTPHSVAKQISDGLAEATLNTLAASRGAIGGCFSSGGDVTASLFQRSETEAIRILGDVVPLTAYVELVGGRLHGLRMVTKGGSIGDESTLAECVQFLATSLVQG